MHWTLCLQLLKKTSEANNLTTPLGDRRVQDSTFICQEETVSINLIFYSGITSPESTEINDIS